MPRTDQRYGGPIPGTFGRGFVDSPVVCVVTRFGVRRPFDMVRCFVQYRRIRRASRRTAGFLRSAFLVEDLRTCYVLSVWKDWDSIPAFGTDVPEHIAAARSVFGHLRRGRRSGPELWSATWRLAAVSNNLNWSTFDLRETLVEPPSKLREAQ